MTDSMFYYIESFYAENYQSVTQNTKFHLKLVLPASFLFILDFSEKNKKQDTKQSL